MVLGHTGFIGAELAAGLSSYFSVKGFSSRQANLSKASGLSSLSRALRPDTVLFVALRAGAKPNEAKRGDSYQSLQRYVTLISNLCALLERRPVRKCVYLSSASVYDDSKSNMKISEKDPLHPQSLYGISKAMGEMLMRGAAASSGFPLLIARPCNVYGANAFARQAINSNTVCLYGDGREKRDQLYVKDLVRALGLLARGPSVGEFNLATGNSVPVRKLIDAMGPPMFIKSKKRTLPLVNLGYNTNKLRRALKGFQFTPLPDAMSETVETIGGTFA